jgi:pimeloyl-ACP methyl ester carboxylesterase
MATYVLVHGGAHGGWCYGPVARILRSAGQEVHAPTLTGLGDRSHLLRPGIDLDTHIADIVEVLHYEDLRDVILVGHSYGGMVITGVADRAPDRVGDLVYLDAATPANGQSLVDIAGPLMRAARAQGRVVDGVELVLFPGTEPLPHYGVTDPADIAWMDERLTPIPGRASSSRSGSPTRRRCGRSPRATSSARRRWRPATPSGWRRPGPPAGSGTSTPATT